MQFQHSNAASFLPPFQHELQSPPHPFFHAGFIVEYQNLVHPRSFYRFFHFCNLDSSSPSLAFTLSNSPWGPPSYLTSEMLPKSSDWLHSMCSGSGHWVPVRLHCAWSTGRDVLEDCCNVTELVCFAIDAACHLCGELLISCNGAVSEAWCAGMTSHLSSTLHDVHTDTVQVFSPTVLTKCGIGTHHPDDCALHNGLKLKKPTVFYSFIRHGSESNGCFNASRSALL